ncbi:hypothetical protein EDI_311780 [Entamoeba dispar SAW760]|uniref:Transmembrane protein n=1 Tax=Entamoeba dispar (strain ATCC PRA-260 / SAW760) TaxID=370354 RepID=B0E9Z6_ENTDS|nr:uncharacterized protein EDI_311780 [Entamoeba dispar SAW760]EDR28645.1 hypothetical protein EDI_311780 [Entamoeba dispar SAW760]|eukprot:EDR28645.1 hypothetical protein EDI_311780 [Entamoeba dispar SAW760]
MSHFKDYFRRVQSQKTSFKILIILTTLCGIMSLVAFSYQFILYGKSEEDDGLYMDLTFDSTNGTCHSYPFKENRPLDFTYFTDAGAYKFYCMPPLTYQIVCHLFATMFTFIFSIVSFVFGSVLVQKKSLIFILAYIAFSFVLLIVGIADTVMGFNSDKFCNNELLSTVDFTHSISEPFSIQCDIDYITYFGVYEIIVALFAAAHGVIIGCLFFDYSKSKKALRDEQQKPYADLKFDSQGNVIKSDDHNLKQSTKNSEQEIELKTQLTQDPSQIEKSKLHQTQEVVNNPDEQPQPDNQSQRTEQNDNTPDAIIIESK